MYAAKRLLNDVHSLVLSFSIILEELQTFINGFYMLLKRQMV
jgi:hypothetical protein